MYKCNFMEIWKDVKGFKGIYKISNYGNVKRLKGIQCKKERILKPINNKRDYMGVCLAKDGVISRKYIHRIVAEAFLENKHMKDEVNHIDGNRKNNKLTNLEWVTRSENHYHRYIVLKQRGVNYGKTGASNWNSKKVNKYSKQGVFIKSYAGVMEAARQTGINESNIRCSCYGKQKTAGGFVWKYS